MTLRFFRARLWTVWLAGALLSACNNAQAGKDIEPEPAAAPPEAAAARVEVATIAQTDARLDVTIPGEVQGYRDSTLASTSGGPVERLTVEEGDSVKQGQVLAHVNTAAYQIQLEQVEAEIAQAEKDLERAKRLGDTIPAAEREQQETNLRLLRVKKKMTLLELGRSIIRAPFAGVVARVAVEIGEVVGPAAPVVRVVQIQPIKVVLSVPDREVVALEPGTEVQISVPAHSSVVPGKIARVSPASDLDTRAFSAEVEADNASRTLLPGMIASVRVERTLQSGAVVIPQHWLVTGRDEIGVFLEKKGVARWRRVQTGRVVRDQVVITEGIGTGDRVVITGHRALADGDPIMVTREGRCCDKGRAIFVSQNDHVQSDSR